jgi:hypothetical protein
MEVTPMNAVKTIGALSVSAHGTPSGTFLPSPPR